MPPDPPPYQPPGPDPQPDQPPGHDDYRIARTLIVVLTLTMTAMKALERGKAEVRHKGEMKAHQTL